MANAKQVISSLDKWVVKESNSILTRLYKGSKEKTPVDTGRAQNAWTITQKIIKTGDTGIISNDTPYIGWLEYGTDRMGEFAMVRRTIQEVKKDY